LQDPAEKLIEKALKSKTRSFKVTGDKASSKKQDKGKKQKKNVTTRDFGEENPTPCTLVIVPGPVAITYRTHYRLISFPYNEIRVQNIIFTSETTW
jgi:hypothetical protein